MRILAIWLALLTLGVVGPAGEGPPVPDSLKAAPPNTWVEVVKSDESGRRSGDSILERGRQRL